MRKRIISLTLAWGMLLALLTPLFPSVSAAGTASLSVAQVTANPGDEVEVTITLAGNPGLAGLELAVAYDSVLTLTDVTFGSTFGSLVTAAEPYTNPQVLAMISPTEASTANGVFATLTFKVAETATNGYNAAIIVTYDEDNVFDADLDNVLLTVTNGSVTVGGITYGDANGDGKINGRDVILLRQYMANYDYTTGTSTVTAAAGADANGDGKINGRDVILMRQYMANYDYTTGSSTVVLGPQK